MSPASFVSSLKSWHAVALSVAFAAMLWGLGDIFDALGYALVWAVFWLLRFRLIGADPRGHSVALGILSVTILLAVGTQLNRVAGYPDKELWPLLSTGAWIILQVAMLACLPLLRQHKRVFVVAALFIYLPLAESPAFVMRQVTASFMVETKEAGGLATSLSPKIDLVYVTKVTWRKVFAVGRDRTISGDPVNVAVVFARRGNAYFYARDAWLLDGEGSMDKQTPNLPSFVWSLLTRDEKQGLFSRLNARARRYITEN